MRIEKADHTVDKGWYLGAWNSELKINVGFANTGVNEPHFHRRMTEIYMIARGTVVMQVNGQMVNLKQDDVIVVEAGEVHTFLSSSPDHFHFVIQVPGLHGDAAKADKILNHRETQR